MRGESKGENLSPPFSLFIPVDNGAKEGCLPARNRFGEGREGIIKDDFEPLN